MKESESHNWLTRLGRILAPLGVILAIGGFIFALVAFVFLPPHDTRLLLIAFSGLILASLGLYIVSYIDEAVDAFTNIKIMYSVVSTILLLTGISSILLSYTSDHNQITISFIRNLATQSSLEFYRPILSNFPEPPSRVILFLEYALAGVGSILYLPLIIIPALSVLLSIIENELRDLFKWIIVGIAAIVFLCYSILGIPPPQWIGDLNPTPTPSISSSAPRPLNPDEKLYFAVLEVQAPPYIKQGQSHILELHFDLRDKNVNGAIPIILRDADSYTAAINTQLVNFDFSSPPINMQENMPININQPVKWQWIITPKTEAEGKQAIVWTVELKDSNGEKYQDLPTVIINVEIKPKLGIPSWILGPNFTLGALLGGLLLNGVGYFMKKNEAILKEGETILKERGVIQRKKKLKKKLEEWIKTESMSFSVFIINPIYGVLVLTNTNGKVPTLVYSPQELGESIPVNETLVKNLVTQNLAIEISNLRIVQDKTKNRDFYVVCNTSALKVSSKHYRCKWIKDFRGIKGMEGPVDEMIMELIRNRFTKKNRAQN